MELKVWVEGIQRVVCGITEQTTVQEVVIALAQATGRTGRYTLVEKWRDMEKLLPPSEYPIKVLEKWGEYAAEVQFLLKRTGASSASSDTENIRAPERNTYRQSLPPPAKHREKSELLQALKRKEPKRKSLTITGTASSHLEESREEKHSQNSNSNNNRVPTDEFSGHVKQNSRDRTYSGGSSSNVKKAAEKFKQLNGDAHRSEVSSGKGRDKSKSKSKDKKGKDESKSGKRALMPPKNEPGKATVSSATKALFPSESKSEVAAKSPVRKHPDNSIKNLNMKKVPLMPPSNKVLRNRNSSSFDQTPQQSSQDSTSPSHISNLSSGSLTPSPFSLPNENKLANYAYRYGNSLPRSKKKSWSESQGPTGDDRKSKAPEGNKKTALMPPMRKRAVTPNPTTSRDSFHPALRDSYQESSSRPMSLKSAEDIKATENFVRLIAEQQKHIEEQMNTVSALDKEIQIVLEKMSQREKSADDEIKKLEEKNRQLRAQMEDEESLSNELSMMDDHVAHTQTDMSRLQAEIDQSEENLASYKRKIDDLTKAIADETYLQSVKQRKQEEEKRNQANKSRKDIDRMNRELSSVENEIRRIERESSLIDTDINEKYNDLDTLNRELRQVNLQQFIRQTGSKVTVLPPNTEDQQENSVHKMYQSNPALNISGSRTPLPPPPSGNSEGVWV